MMSPSLSLEKCIICRPETNFRWRNSQPMWYHQSSSSFKGYAKCKFQLHTKLGSLLVKLGHWILGSIKVMFTHQCTEESNFKLMGARTFLRKFFLLKPTFYENIPSWCRDFSSMLFLKQLLIIRFYWCFPCLFYFISLLEFLRHIYIFPASCILAIFHATLLWIFMASCCPLRFLCKNLNSLSFLLLVRWMT